jgi:hypothetical protein
VHVRGDGTRYLARRTERTSVEPLIGKQVMLRMVLNRTTVYAYAFEE